MRLKAFIVVLLLFPALFLFLASSVNGQWREVQLNDDDMASSLTEALTFQKYPTYPQYLEMLHYFAQTYPDICRVDTFGTTGQGRLLLAMKISDNVAIDEAEASFLYTSSMHGNELVGYPLMLRLIDHLLSEYGSDSEVTRLVDELAIWINPLANPDGTYYPDNDLSVALSVRETADGTDMNREFPDPAAGDLVDDTVGRARETKAMMAFLQEHRFTMSANIHSGAEVVNYPWDHTYSLHADDNWFRFISREYADEARAVDPDYMSLFTDGITNGAQWYRIYGGRQDYVNWYLEGREITLELCNDFRLTSELLDEFWQKNERSLLNYMAQCTFGIRGRVTDTTSGLPVVARVEIAGHDTTYSVVQSRAPHGDFYRLLREGNYDLLVSAAGYITDTITGVLLSDYHATWVDVALEPLPISAQPETGLTFSIWPNPAGEQLFIQPGTTLAGLADVMIFSSDGVLLQQERCQFSGATVAIGLDMIPTGIFLVRITSGTQSAVSPTTGTQSAVRITSGTQSAVRILIRE